MKKRIISIILVVFISLIIIVSNSFASTYNQPTKNSTIPIMFLYGDDDDPLHG